MFLSFLLLERGSAVIILADTGVDELLLLDLPDLAFVVDDVVVTAAAAELTRAELDVSGVDVGVA